MRQKPLSVVLAVCVLMMATGLAGLAPAQTTQVKFAPIPAGEYRIDTAHSVIAFAIKHNEIALVRGRFREFSGKINYNDTDITKSSVEVTAKVESINTGVDRRDAHLRTADFFDAATYPELTFKSTHVEKKGNNQYVLHGDLTLRGITKPVAIPFTIAGAIKDGQGNTRFGVAGQTTINRRDFGFTWGKTMENGGLDVGNEVMIDLQLEAVKPAPKPPAS
ncbi:MAG TPA: YceI family protein [Pyrinomonadaceae bacterium]|nr:YceI family protein [Pyrinomonadaceae bacterium]